MSSVKHHTDSESPSRPIPSVYRLVRDTKCQTSQSPNDAANQLDIFLVCCHIGFGCQYIGFKCLITLLLLLHFTMHVSITHVCTEKPTFVLSFIYMCAIIWPPAPLKICYLARHLKEVARACSMVWSINSFAKVFISRYRSL